ncbi:MAG TPA: PqiC family protein [Candidatus Binataceae bacterium]
MMTRTMVTPATGTVAPTCLAQKAALAAALCIMVSALMAVTGCTSAPPKFYSLSSTSTPIGLAPANLAVLVGPISIPAGVDRPEFVVQDGGNKVDIEEFNRWSAPLNDSIAKVVAGDLSALLGTPDVATAPLANFNAAYRVTIDVQRFDSIRGQGAVLDAVWVVRKANGATQTGRTVAHETVQGDSFDALAAAHSRALARMSADIATAIRAEDSQTAEQKSAESAG